MPAAMLCGAKKQNLDRLVLDKPESELIRACGAMDLLKRKPGQVRTRRLPLYLAARRWRGRSG